ncbi:5972_t:CDS:1, partial [Scutellospora calospora]
MTETDQNDQNVSSNSDSKRMSRTRSVIGPRPFPSSHSLRKKNNDRVSEDYSNSLTPEQSRSGTPDQPFPPLVSPKPQKPMPT